MFFSVFFAFISIHSFSQNNKLFIYEVKVKPEPKKDSLITKYILLEPFINGKSYFRTSEDKQEDSLNTKGISLNTNLSLGVESSVKDDLYIIKNYKSHTKQKYVTQLFNNYVIKINENLNWKLLEETKLIGQYNCQKAKVNYGGRLWTAWFTKDIPINDGPYVFDGLPGLIIDIVDSDNDYHFSLIEVSKNKSTNTFEKPKPIGINWTGYEKIFMNYYTNPTKDFGTNGTFSITKWVDKDGNEVKMDFRELNAKEQKKLRRFNNPIELNHKINYK